MIIARRFCGPPESANGGYACGVVAGLLDGERDIEATLRSPPPLDRELIGEVVDGKAILRDGDTIVAEAIRTTLTLDVPPPVSFADAERATKNFPNFLGHAFRQCFVCGPERTGDGLRIFPGAASARGTASIDLAAAPWIPDASVCMDDRVTPEIVWAALDCPSWFGMHCFHPWQGGGVLLGRLAARIVDRPRIGEKLVAAGWFLGRDGRKMTCGSALYSGDEVRAFARSTWIALKS